LSEQFYGFHKFGTHGVSGIDSEERRDSSSKVSFLKRRGEKELEEA